LQAPRLDPAREAGDRPSLIRHDGGERPDHVRPVPEPRHEVVVRGLLALPRQLLPGGPQPFELLERARELDPDSGGRRRLDAHLAGTNWKPTCTPRLRDSPPLGGMRSASGTLTSTLTGVCVSGMRMMCWVAFCTVTCTVRSMRPS